MTPWSRTSFCNIWSNVNLCFQLAWIGLFNDVNTWRWSMPGSNIETFRNWRAGQPNNQYGREACGETGSDGTWDDGDCSLSQRPVCINVTGDKLNNYRTMNRCSDQCLGVILFPSMFSYKGHLTVSTWQMIHTVSGPFSESKLKFALIDLKMNWTQAQRYCRDHYTDLARIRNQAENQLVKDLVPAVWMGLYRDTWKWTNGSRSSFRYWSSGEASTGMENCAAANFGDSGKWEKWICDTKKAFICYSGKNRTNFWLDESRSFIYWWNIKKQSIIPSERPTFPGVSTQTENLHVRMFGHSKFSAFKCKIPFKIVVF